jgi:hypothetical protein
MGTEDDPFRDNLLSLCTFCTSAIGRWWDPPSRPRGSELHSVVLGGIACSVRAVELAE